MNVKCFFLNKEYVYGRIEWTKKERKHTYTIEEIHFEWMNVNIFSVHDNADDNDDGVGDGRTE